MNVQSSGNTDPASEDGKHGGFREILWRPQFIMVWLALITLAVFGSVRTHEFVSLDDPTYVTANPSIAHGLTWKGMIWALGTDYSGNWHPLTWMSHMLDVTVFGTGTAGPHIVNLLFHTANVVLLFLVLRGLTFAHWRSAIVAALFALHPLHVESVAWVAERKDVLSTFFWMLTLLMYTRYVRSAKGRARNYTLALLFFALGLMSKSMQVTIPFVLLLLDYWPLKRVSSFEFRVQSLGNSGGRGRRVTLAGLIIEKWPFFLLSAVVSVITFEVQNRGGAVAHLEHYTIGQRVNTAFIAYVEYLGKTFWPVKLAVFYPNPGHWPVAKLLLSILLIIGVSVAAVYYGRRWRFLFTGWFWFLGMLVPVIGLVQVGGQALADRYTYVSLVGIFIIVVWGVGALMIRWRVPMLASAVVALVVVGACSAVTVKQLRYWQNSETLFRHALMATGDNFVGYCGLGYYYVSAGRVDEAIANYELGYRINPHDLQVLRNLGAGWSKKRDYAQAAHYFQAAEREKPDDASIHSALGDVFLKAKKYDEAVAEDIEALRLKPDDVAAHCALGEALEEQKKYAEAMAEFTRAMGIEPTARAECGLGDVMHDQGKPDDALKHYANALRLEPDSALAHYAMANLMSEIGQNDIAIEQYTDALKCQPQFAEAENNLGTMLMRLGRMDEAVAHFRAVIQYEPNHVGAHANLASVLVGQHKFDEAVAEYSEALQLDADSLEAHFGIAVALAQLGRREEAIAHLHEVLRIKPDLESAQQFLEKLEAGTRK